MTSIDGGDYNCGFPPVPEGRPLIHGAIGDSIFRKPPKKTNSPLSMKDLYGLVVTDWKYIIGPPPPGRYFLRFWQEISGLYTCAVWGPNVLDCQSLFVYDSAHVLKYRADILEQISDAL